MAITPSLCGITYDSDYFERERFQTAYRIPSASDRVFIKDDSNALRISVSGTHLDFLHPFYHTNSYVPSNVPLTSQQIPSRCQSTFACYMPGRDPLPETRCERHPQCSMSLPSLSRNTHRYFSDADVSHHGRVSTARLKWVDALNAWVSEEEYSQGKSYISFVNTAPRVEKHCSAHIFKEDRGSQVRCEYCYRFQMHMHRFNTTTHSCSIAYLRRAMKTGLEQKSAIQNRTAAEIAERRKTRKAYSTPVYSRDIHRPRTVRFQPPDSSGPSPVLFSSSPAEAWMGQRNEDNEEERNEREETGEEKEDETVADGEKVDGKDETDFCKQLDSLTLDTPVLTATAPATAPADNEEEEAGELESQVTPDIKDPQKVSSVKDKERLERKNKLADSLRKSESGKGNKWRKAVAKSSYTAVDDKFNVADIISETVKLAKSYVRIVHHSEKRTPSHVVHRSKKQPEKIFSKPKAEKHPAPSPKSAVKTSTVSKKPSKISSDQKSGKKNVSTAPESVHEQQSDFKAFLQPLPVTPLAEPEKNTATENETAIPTAPEPTTQISEDITVKKVDRAPIKKRERVTTTRRPIQDQSSNSEQVAPELVCKPVSDWIFDADDDTTDTTGDQDKSCSVSIPQPQLPSVADLPKVTPAEKLIRAKRRLTALSHKPVEGKKHWGPKKRDTSYWDELRKQELAEARRLRQQQMLDKLLNRKQNKGVSEDDDDDLGPNFDDYGFLAKYCILNRSSLEMYRHAFNVVDEEHRGHLTGPETMLALRVVNNKLTSTEEEYIYRILELVGYKITDGADFKLFSVLAALSQRITSLDNWMKNIIGQVDFKILEMKTFMCKTLWECNVDPDTNRIPLTQLLIDLRAGGVSFQHECEIREKLSHLSALDLLDFLTYIPLFIMIHESVVDNPLDDSRVK